MKKNKSTEIEIIETETLPPAHVLSEDKMAMVKEFSRKITANLEAAAGGLNNAALLLREATLNGCGEAVMADLAENSPFSTSTLNCLKTTVNRVIPFIEQMGGDPRRVGSLDGMRQLLPKVASLDSSSGVFRLADGAEEVVKRALSGESPRKLVKEITGSSTTSSSKTSASIHFKVARLVDGLTTGKGGKHDCKAIARNAGRGAARIGLTLEEAISELTEGYNKESDAILAREQRAAAKDLAKSEKLATKQAAKKSSEKSTKTH